MGFGAVAQGELGARVDGLGVVEGLAEFGDRRGLTGVGSGSNRTCKVLVAGSGMMSPEPARAVRIRVWASSSARAKPVSVAIARARDCAVL